tara:strand:- start:1702 stop:2595 length:894 start_codon:yes stop_codon:yes gene_type:complete
MTNSESGWEVRPLSPALGAEVIGPKINNLNDDQVKKLKELLLEHLVIFMPGQSPSPALHVEFGKRFGSLEGHPNLSSDDKLPREIFELKASKGGIADEWHTDLTFRSSPAIMSIMHIVKCPEVGGDTLWSSTYAAYDQLSSPMKDLCEGLTALHDAHPHNQPDQMAIHPVVRLHPETQRRALYINQHFTQRIVELSAEESEAVLKYLIGWISHPKFSVRYRWRPGTVCMWDNRCTQHMVLNDFTGERVIQRVTVTGDKVFGVKGKKYNPALNSDRLSAQSRHDRQLFMHLKNEDSSS